MYIGSTSAFLGVCRCAFIHIIHHCNKSPIIILLSVTLTCKMSCEKYKLIISQLQVQYQTNYIYSPHQRIHMHIIPGILKQCGQSRYVHAHLQRQHMAVRGTSHQLCYCLHSCPLSDSSCSSMGPMSIALVCVLHSHCMHWMWT